MALHRIPQNEMSLHDRADYCKCVPTPKMEQRNGLLQVVWTHHQLSLADFDVEREAQSILEATSVRLWEAAEKTGAKLTVVPFDSMNPIKEPGNQPRFNWPKDGA